MSGGRADVRTTVVVVTWRGRDHLRPCLAALAAQTRAHAVLVVDNDADDATRAVLAGSGVPVLRLGRNRGYAGALAAVRVGTELVCWLNDDAVLPPGWLAAAEDALEPGLAALGAHLVDHDGATTSLGVTLDRHGRGRDRRHAEEPLAAPCGAAVLLRTDALAEVGGVDGALFCYSEDLDVGWRLQLAGHRVAVLGSPAVTHVGGASSGPGSPAFHRWNERNRLLVLLRDAPLCTGVREVAAFAALTGALALRRGAQPPNFRVPLRLRVLAEVALRTPGVLRRRAGTRATRAATAHALGVR